uniref:RNA-directed RNA polymerase L n=1 Tax=Mammarenavirus lunaense TaxID=3052315 RepID=A0A8F1NKS5_9VIRU|nr:polymerase [Mammarenavirus lunaense]
MELDVSELKNIISRNMKDDQRLSRQKLNFLIQSEPQMLLIEGLKLLSLCIELDSCEANGCEHNTDELSVEAILLRQGIPSPGLPLVVPDGYKIQGNILILLECFVRSSPANYEQKFAEDSVKLNSLKQDLSSSGIVLLPIIDGRTSFQHTFMPEWANDKFRSILFSLLQYSQESSRLLEESEYSRLCESLKNIEGGRSGIENLNILQDHRAQHHEEILRLCHGGLNHSMSSLEVKREIITEFQAFRNGLNSNLIQRQFVRVSKEELLASFNKLYPTMFGVEPEPVDTLCREFTTISPVVMMIYSKIDDNVCQGNIDSCVPKWKSLLNKVKSLKVLNTRRRVVLLFDSIILLCHANDFKRFNKVDESEWLGSSFLSVNDRLVSLDSTKRELKLWLERRKANLLRKSKLFVSEGLGATYLNLIEPVLRKAKEALSIVGLSFDDFGVSEEIFNPQSYDGIVNLVVSGMMPSINYERNALDEFPYSVELSLDDSEDLKRLSSISLALVNSMKTSSLAKLRQNEKGAARYKKVHCKEAYCQELFMGGIRFKLLYQKTGECSKCYAINNSKKGEVCSFYADPKRYFPSIFSQFVIEETITTMVSWLEDCDELKKSLRDIKHLLKMLFILILTHPSKRSQKFLQNIRYFVMAYVSDYYHRDLMSKLEEKLITEVEFLLFRVTRTLLNIVLAPSVKTMLTNRFKFVLNVSYMCHFITKETPDRLTDQIKCFEKYLEPKLEFDSVFVNPSEPADSHELSYLLDGCKEFLSKPMCSFEEEMRFKKPGVSQKLLSMMTSSFNNGVLFRKGDLKQGIKDPLVLSGCATALDLASNKSVVINKFIDGERILNYDYDKLVAAAVCQLSETFVRKGKFLLDRDDYDYKILKVITDLVIGNKRSIDPSANEELDEMLFDSATLEFLDEVKDSVASMLSNYKPVSNGVNTESSKEGRMGDISDLRSVIDNKVTLKLIMSELSNHLVEDFDRSLLSDDDYEDICRKIYSDSKLRDKYFYKGPMDSCAMSEITRAVTTKTFENEDYFQCFKSILLQMNANKLSGKFSHYKSKCFNFKLNRDRLMEDCKISDRESNSEALSKALSLTNCTTAVLKNLCFYSQESPQSYTSIGPDTGRLKFSLSYKEQVGGNRELYIGDLRTKMFTRLIEDYFEALTSQFKGSCLNDEKEFDNAILDMKLNVSQAQLCYSLDHSKWGPMMNPLLFLVTLQNIQWGPNEVLDDIKSRDYVSTLLCWHIHKLIEVPHSVVTAMMRSYLKSNLGLKKSMHETLTEAFFFRHFKLGIIPSHISSVIDMGQGILHNASDFYGLISEKFINYCIGVLYEGELTSYTSSDDQISLFDPKLTGLMERDPDEFEYILEFHYYLSDRLNKFISPKSVIGKFVAEFKSRFFVWGDEVPLLTKFVAAALHNIKCKEPHQLSETIDTIIDQAVANGVPVRLCNMIQQRTLDLIRYAQCPIDPFLMFCKSDVKDWVDGNRGYRIMRNIECLCPTGTKKIRHFLRRLYNKLKTGELHEEFTAAYLSGDPTNSLQKMCSLLDCESLDQEEIGMCWLNLAAYFPIRMVLRQKVIYTGALSLEEEKLPTLVKTLQNKLSSNYTRGAQKLLSEAINKSAFQSSIASGFVGLCKTLGSKCVRGPDKLNLYIKSLVSQLERLEGVSSTIIDGMNLWLVSDSTRKEEIWLLKFLRPVLWDYMCIALSCALEIGPWVLGEPKIKSVMKSIKFKPCDYFPIKPTVTKLLEDKVGFNHIIHSFRRLYPAMFEKHLLPFMSDLASTKMKWSPRVKFLDLCVVLDVNCEAMSLVSHVVKWKREEHYVVLSSELSVSHDRSHVSFAEERVVSTEDVAENFLRQVFFESFVRSFVITSRTLGSFTWFPHKSSLPASEGLNLLGPFATFIEKVVFKGIERPMYKSDLYMGYSWLDMDIKPAHVNMNQVVAAGLTETGICETLEDLWDAFRNLPEGAVQLSMSVYFKIKSRGESLNEEFAFHIRTKGSLSDQDVYNVSQLEVLYSGAVHRSVLVDCWRLVMNSVQFKKINPIWFVDGDLLSDLMVEPKTIGPSIPLKVRIGDDLLDLCEYDFCQVGPEPEPVPLVIENGYLLEGKRKLVPLNPSIHDQDLEVLITELSDDPLSASAEIVNKIMVHRINQKLHWLNLDIIEVTKKCRPSDHRDFLRMALSSLCEWTGFKGYTLCFSKSLNDVMIHSSQGKFRLKGRQCNKLFEEPAQPEDIE